MIVAGLLAAAVGVALGALALAGVLPLPAPPSAVRYLSPQAYEQWAREQFARLHPGERPLNWRLAQEAVRFHREQPMGRFVLAVKPGEWGNDCSDFVECIVDEGLGVGARVFHPGRRDHTIGLSDRYFDFFSWDRGAPLQPGDTLTVRHSPWYAPSDEAAWHIGIVGADGMVYDFAKLRSWSAPRYGRHTVDWFTRRSPAPAQVQVGRLKPSYRFLIEPIPTPG